jgi:UDP-N-acetylmuramate--alanine ligase
MMNKTVCTKETLLPLLRARNIEILLALGAGDIDRLVPSIAALIEES